jgi:hypothetical protein
VSPSSLFCFHMLSLLWVLLPADLALLPSGRACFAATPCCSAQPSHCIVKMRLMVHLFSQLSPMHVFPVLPPNIGLHVPSCEPDNESTVSNWLVACADFPSACWRLLQVKLFFILQAAACVIYHHVLKGLSYGKT